MSEEFAVDGSFGDGTAVYGEVFLAFPWRIVVYEPWDYLLAHAAFSHDEHRQVGGCHLQGDIEGSVEGIAVSYDVIALLYCLQL